MIILLRMKNICSRYITELVLNFKSETVLSDMKMYSDSFLYYIDSTPHYLDSLLHYFTNYILLDYCIIKYRNTSLP